MTLVPDFDFENASVLEMPCKVCGAKNDRATGDTPQKGSLSVCASCCTVSELISPTESRVLTHLELWNFLNEEPGLRHAMAVVALVLKEQASKAN